MRQKGVGHFAISFTLQPLHQQPSTYNLTANKRLFYPLLPVYKPYLHAKLGVYMLSKMLCRINRAVLATRTAKREHERGEPSLYIPCYMRVSKFIDRIKEGYNLTIIFKESYHRFVNTRQMFIRLITSRVMRTATVKDITTTVTRCILWYALMV